MRLPAPCLIWPLHLRGRRLPWPAPALLTWLAAWGLALLLRQQAPALGLAGAMLPASLLGLGVALGMRRAGWVRRGMLAAGFPLSALASGWAGRLLDAGAHVTALPAWAWLLALGLLLATYPMRAWRDAPLFPTPRGALAGLQACTGLAPGARVLDAGCGLGHGLQALRRLWPDASLHGLEWSAPLSWAAAWRCRRQQVQIQRGDMWAASWAGHDLVYVFQRPESMARVFDKARRELAPAAWLVSLEFAVPGQTPWACVQGPGRRPLWIYRPAAAGPPASTLAPQGR